MHGTSCEGLLEKEDGASYLAPEIVKMAKPMPAQPALFVNPEFGIFKALRLFAFSLRFRMLVSNQFCFLPKLSVVFKSTHPTSFCGTFLHFFDLTHLQVVSNF
jgi:hypothetical protein